MIIDDEPHAQRLLQNYVKEIPFLIEAGVCSDALEAMKFLNTESVDLIFLDIQMPKSNRYSATAFFKKPTINYYY